MTRAECGSIVSLNGYEGFRDNKIYIVGLRKSRCSKFLPKSEVIVVCCVPDTIVAAKKT